MQIHLAKVLVKLLAFCYEKLFCLALLNRCHTPFCSMLIKMFRLSELEICKLPNDSLPSHAYTLFDFSQWSVLLRLINQVTD